MKSSVVSKQDPAPVEIFLRIKHPSMDPANITEKLGIEPEHAVHAGLAASRSGIRRLHSESYWLARLPSQGMRERIENLRSFSPRQALPTLPKDKLVGLLGATLYDLHILEALQPLSANKMFLLELNREGSTTLLLQREDRTLPVTLRTSLVLLTELGIGLEID